MTRYAVFVRTPWDGFVIGQHKPDAETTGVPDGTSLETISGDQTITTNGTLIEDKRIEGRVFVQAANVILRNCEIVGTTTVFTNPSSPTGLVICTGVGQSVTLERCTLRPQSPGPCVDGIRGWGITMIRCDVSRVTDGVGVIPPSGGLNGGLVMRGCYVHHLAFWTQSGWGGPVHPSDTATHNDCVQVHGGSGCQFEGNFFEACSSFPQGVGQNPNAANRINVGVQLDVSGSLGPINGTEIERNWFDFGFAGQIQAAPGEAIGDTEIVGNRFTSNNSSGIEIRMNGRPWTGTDNTRDGSLEPRSN